MRMSMIPFFPSLRPSVSASICFDVDMPCDDESELRNLERDHVTYLKSIQVTAIDLAPVGGGGGPDPESDDEAAAEDSEESESHEEDDEDDMETVDVNPGINVSTATMDLPET